MIEPTKELVNNLLFGSNKSDEASIAALSEGSYNKERLKYYYDLYPTMKIQYQP